MTQEHIQANRFELKGHQTEITYDETSVDGQPRLNYRVFQGLATRTFVGEQIRSQESEIGAQVSVTLEAVEDGDSTLLTLILPTVNLLGTTEQDFETIAIVTTIRGGLQAQA